MGGGVNDDAEFKKCVYVSRHADRCIAFRCRKGLWTVSGTDTVATRREAIRCFELCRSNGAYDNLLGRETESRAQ